MEEIAGYAGAGMPPSQYLSRLCEIYLAVLADISNAQDSMSLASDSILEAMRDEKLETVAIQSLRDEEM